MKKLLLSLFVILTTLPAMAYYDEIIERDGITYRVGYDYEDDDESYHYGNRSVEIISTSADLNGDIILPTFITHNGKKYLVGGILDEAFMNRDKITSVTLPEELELIANRAFYNCTSLTAINIPSSVEAIWDSAFGGCSKLEDIVLPEKLNYIGTSAFTRCDGLKTINIPPSVKTIENNTFADCISLNSVYMPGQVTYIGDESFSGCENLALLDLPASVEHIGRNAFSGCEKWRLSLPASLTYIGDYAFSYCPAPGSITISKFVTSIGNHPFYLCPGLNEINVDSENPNYASIDGVLFDKEITQLVSYPIYATRNEYTLPSTVTYLPSEAFLECENLISVNIPGDVTTLNGGTFAYCKNLNSVTLPETLTSIKNDFIHCGSLTHIKIPNSVTIIGDDAFRYCYALVSVDFPESLQAIKFSAFSDCHSLISVDIPDGTRYFDEYVFAACNHLKTVTLPASLISISSSSITYYGWAFGECNEIEDVYYKAEKPVALDGTMFSQTTYDNAILHVPAVAVEKAAVTLPWSKFKNIKAHDFSSAITDVFVDSDEDTPVEVYNLSGIKVADNTEALAPGIYIVRHGNKVKKIAVK